MLAGQTNRLYFRLVPCVSCLPHGESSHSSHGNPVGGRRWLAGFDLQTSGEAPLAWGPVTDGKICVPV